MTTSKCEIEMINYDFCISCGLVISKDQKFCNEKCKKRYEREHREKRAGKRENYGARF